jgi:uncharacterized protein (TIGR02217 family)
MRSKFVCSAMPDSSVTPANRQAWIDGMLGFFMAGAGKALPFRTQDVLDYQAWQQTMIPLGGNQFQLQKIYVMGARAYTRIITKPAINGVDGSGNPIPGFLNIYVGGVLQTSGYTVDYETGIVTCTGFDGTTALVDFQFDVFLRFDTDWLALAVEESFVSGGQPLGSWDSFPMIEVLPPGY